MSELLSACNDDKSSFLQFFKGFQSGEKLTKLHRFQIFKKLILFNQLDPTSCANFEVVACEA